MSTQLHLRMEQKLTMSPYLHQMMEILQLQVLDLEQRINEELETNPLLEADDSENDKEKQIDEEDSKYDELVKIFEDSSDIGRYNYSTRSNNDTKSNFIEGVLTQPESLQDHLIWQLRLHILNEKDFQIGERIISNINEKGYLISSTEEIAAGMNISTEEVDKILKIIQAFEPYGVGARNLQECMLIQLRFIPEKKIWAEKIVKNYFDLLYKHKVKDIAYKLNVDIITVEKTISFIQKLDPNPGLMYYNKVTEYVTPDAQVEKTDDNDFVIIINDEWVPKLHIQKSYRNMIKNKKIDNKIKKYLREKVKYAMLFIKSIEQRKTTLYKVAEAILRFQRQFFVNGTEYIAPLTLKDIADHVRVHESTISRVTSNKYMQTPYGIFKMKYFFSRKIRTETEGDISTKRIMIIIKELVENEVKPLSDDEIRNILKKQGINIARRTVSKYRKKIRILPSYLRKK